MATPYTPSLSRFRLRAAARRVGLSSGQGHALPPVFIMTDPERLPPLFVMDMALVPGWAIVYRHFGSPDRAEQASALRSFCDRNRLVFLVANDPELARHVRANGVHWPEKAAHRAKRWHKRFSMMTVSWHGRRPPRALAIGMDGVLVSTVFPSQSPSASEAMGAVRFRSLARSSEMPIYGLGGINARNAGRISSISRLAGIDGFKCLVPRKSA